MKPVFCIDITEDKKNERINGEALITKSVSDKEKNRLESNHLELEETVDESRLPWILRIVKAICGFGGAMILIATLRAAGDIGLAKAWQNAPVLVAFGPILIAVWGVLQLFSKHREKRVMEEKSVVEQLEVLDQNYRALYAELGVPEDAASMDVIAFRYRVKKGEVKPATVGMSFDALMSAFQNLEVKVFTREGMLCLSTAQDLYEIPINEISKIRTVKKTIPFNTWNKEVDPRDEFFKKYKLGVNNYGQVLVRPYHVLEISHAGEDFCIWFPCYELPTVEALTGLKAD